MANTNTITKSKSRKFKENSKPGKDSLTVTISSENADLKESTKKGQNEKNKGKTQENLVTKRKSQHKENNYKT